MLCIGCAAAVVLGCLVCEYQHVLSAFAVLLYVLGDHGFFFKLLESFSSVFMVMVVILLIFHCFCGIIFIGIWEEVFAMLTAIFVIALIYVFIRMILFAIKAAWGIAKCVAFIVLLPLIIVGLAIAGMFYIALGLAIVVAIIATIGWLIAL